MKFNHLQNKVLTRALPTYTVFFSLSFSTLKKSLQALKFIQQQGLLHALQQAMNYSGD